MLLEQGQIRRTFAGILGQGETPTTPTLTPVATPVVEEARRIITEAVATPTPTPTVKKTSQEWRQYAQRIAEFVIRGPRKPVLNYLRTHRMTTVDKLEKRVPGCLTWGCKADVSISIYRDEWAEVVKFLLARLPVDFSAANPRDVQRGVEAALKEYCIFPRSGKKPTAARAPVTPVRTPTVRTPAIRTPAVVTPPKKRSLRRWAEVAQAHFESIMNTAVVPYINRSQFRSTFRPDETVRVTQLRKRYPPKERKGKSAGGCRGAVPVWTADFEAIKEFIISQATPEMKAAEARDKTANTRTAFRRAARAAMDEYCIWQTKGSPEKYAAEQAARPPYPKTGAAYENHLAAQAAWILKRSSGYEYKRGISPEKKAQLIASAAEYEHRTSKYNIPLSEWNRKIAEVAADWDFYLGSARLTPAQARSKLKRLGASAKRAFEKSFEASIKRRAAHLKKARFATINQSMMDGYIRGAAATAIRKVEDDPRFIFYSDEHYHATGGREGISPANKYIMQSYLNITEAEQFIGGLIAPAYYGPLGARLFKKHGIKLSAAPVTPTVTPVALAPGEAEELARSAAAGVFWNAAKQAGIKRKTEAYKTEWKERRLRAVQQVISDAKYRTLIDTVVEWSKGRVITQFKKDKRLFDPAAVPDQVWRAAAEAVAADQRIFPASRVPVAITPAEITPAAVTPAEKRRITPMVIAASVAKHIELARRGGRIRWVRRGGRNVREITPAGFRQVVEGVVSDIVAWLQGAEGYSGFAQVTPADPELIRQIRAAVEAAMKEKSISVAPSVTPTITPTVTPVPTPPLTPVKRKRPAKWTLLNTVIDEWLREVGLPLRNTKRVYVNPRAYANRNTAITQTANQRGLEFGYTYTVANVEYRMKQRRYYPGEEEALTPTTPFITPTLTPHLTPRQIQEQLNRWAARAPMYDTYEACRRAAEAATQGTPDRWTQCISRDDVVRQAVSNALDRANMSTRPKKRGVTRTEFDTLAQNAKQMANVMIAQKTYTPQIRGRRLRMYQ